MIDVGDDGHVANLVLLAVCQPYYLAFSLRIRARALCSMCRMESIAIIWFWSVCQCGSKWSFVWVKLLFFSLLGEFERLLSGGHVSKRVVQPHFDLVSVFLCTLNLAKFRVCFLRLVLGFVSAGVCLEQQFG